MPLVLYELPTGPGKLCIIGYVIMLGRNNYRVNWSVLCKFNGRSSADVAKRVFSLLNAYFTSRRLC